MTKEQIDAILDQVRTWPLEVQEDAAAILLRMEEQGVAPYVLSPDERTEVEAGLAETARGEFATHEEVEAVFSRYRRA
jgi:hypothetical protein